MAEMVHSFVEWKEHFVSQERGNRVVHYFLKDSAGESVRAVIGTERSVRHMFYVVAEEFVELYGAANSIHAGFKWRSRREVVDWLTSMLSKQHLQSDQSKSAKKDLAQARRSPESPMNGFGAQQGRFSKTLNGQNSDIVWSGTAWSCGKQLKHYPAFCRNGISIAIQSFVFVMAKGENHYLAYLEDMYEDKRGQKKVKVRWFHYNQEVKGVVTLSNCHPKEVFITPYSQVISAECVDGPATVLTREHYHECLGAFPNAPSTKMHMCFRQFRGNRVKPFDLCKLRGYFDQPILSCLNSKPFPGANSIGYELNDKEDKDLSPDENLKLGVKRIRRGMGWEKFDADYSGDGLSNGQMNTFESSYLNLRPGKPGKSLLPLKDVQCQTWCKPLFKPDEKIELLCQDSGIRGCWFRCTILQVSRKQIKVQYDDVQDEDEYGNLEEWIPVFKSAAPDKLGMRCSGRPTIRPAPPPSQQTGLVFEVGSAIDAWWSDGWWEGVVIGVSDSDSNIQHVYFPGENFFLSIHKKDIRISRDWVGEQWINIQSKPDILSTISATISEETKMSMCSIIAEDTKSDSLVMLCPEVMDGAKHSIVEEKKPGLAMLSSSDSFLEDMSCLDIRKSPSSNGETNEDEGNDMNVSCDKVDEAKEGEVGSDVNEDGNKIDPEMLESSDQNNCKAIELMDVAA